MTEKNLANIWGRAAADLGLDVVSPFSVTLPSGARVDADVLVRNFGANLGMLIVTEYKKVAQYADELVEQGYGYSVMGPSDDNAIYDRDSFGDVLTDWGWSGQIDKQPAWLKMDE